jgi:hypothetical protein
LRAENARQGSCVGFEQRCRFSSKLPISETIQSSETALIDSSA